MVIHTHIQSYGQSSLANLHVFNLWKKTHAAIRMARGSTQNCGESVNHFTTMLSLSRFFLSYIFCKAFFYYWSMIGHVLVKGKHTETDSGLFRRHNSPGSDTLTMNVQMNKVELSPTVTIYWQQLLNLLCSCAQFPLTYTPVIEELFYKFHFKQHLWFYLLCLVLTN